MARLIEKLTPMAVSKAKAPGYIGVGAGLWLRVSPSLSKSWIFRYTKDRKAKVLSLGSCITVGLKEAREKVKRYQPKKDIKNVCLFNLPSNSP